MQTKSTGTTDVPEDPFHQCLMIGGRRMHVETSLLHCILDIRPRHREVLKSTNNAAVGGRVVRRERGA